MKSSSVEWSAGDSAGESEPAAYVESGKNFPMGPLDSDEADEVTSALGMTMISWSSPVCCVSFLTLVLLQGLVPKMRPLRRNRKALLGGQRVSQALRPRQMLLCWTRYMAIFPLISPRRLRGLGLWRQ